MHPKTWLLTTCSFLLSLTSFSQKADVTPWITKVEIDSNTIEVLRVPPERFRIIRPDIMSIQHDLDRCRTDYNKGITTYLHSLANHCRFIGTQDPTFPTQYYLAEITAYENWNPKNEARITREREEAYAKREDSINLVNLKGRYSWINADTARVKATPDLKGSPIGSLFRLSYIEAYVVEGKPDWMHVFFGDHSGYVYTKDIANSWEEMALEENELKVLKRGRFYNFTPSAAYKAQLAREAAEIKRATRAAASRTYYVGPRGGCYYINANGNKQYVDRSNCN